MLLKHSQVKIKDVNSLPLLEPLSDATSSVLKAIKLNQHDFLEVSCDEEQEHFYVQSTRMVEIPFELTMFTPEDEVVQLGNKFYHRTGTCSFAAANNWQYKIPERRNIGFGKWKFAATDFTALVIRYSWPIEKVFFISEDAQVMYDVLLLRFLSQSRAALNTARYKIDRTVPEMPDDYVEHPELPLTGYQKVGFVNSLSNSDYALFMEQGTGKTPIVIAKVNLLGQRLRKTENKMYRVLVLCPKSIRMNWENEFVRFSTCAGKVTILRGTQVDRVRCLTDSIRSEDDCNWSATICSVDSVANSWKVLKKIPWDMVVLDESHSIKSPTTKRFKTLRQLENTESKMILTGTPITNHVFDLWSQLEFLGHGLSGFSTFSNFRSFHGKFETQNIQGSRIQKLVGLKGLPLIQERLSRLSFLLNKSEADLGLPDKVYDMYEVSMTPTQKEWYVKLRDELCVQIETALADETKTLSIDHILTMLLHLAQITSGHVKWNPEEEEDENGNAAVGKVEQIPGGNPKVDAVLEMIKEQEETDPNCKTIVWATFIEDVRVLSETLAERGVNHVVYHPKGQKEYRAKDAFAAAERFNNDKDCKVFIGNPASGGEGLNLIGYDKENADEYETFAGHEIFFSCNWSSVQRSQAEDRAHRRGTRNNVRITDLMIPGTIDEEIRARVMAKRASAMAIQDIREILTNILGVVTSD